ncbi:MAG TPA: hypothetical protein VF609_12205 [Flavisolibacter sp.]
MTNTIEEEIQHYLLQLNEAEKNSVLQLLKTFIGERTGKSERISLEQYNQELGEAEAEFERGEYVSHEEMLKQMKQW